MNFSFENTYARLPDRLYARVTPTAVRAPRLLRINEALAEELGVAREALEGPEVAAMLSGNLVPAGAEPIALAYAGHQFGRFVPQLGDGRAILLGDVRDRHGRLRDVQLKGAGRTPFSRGGDGRAAVGPVLREYLVSEAMAALGVPTTRALAAVATGEPVYRDEVLPGAVLTRVASSHLRVGTFEFFAARDDHEALRALTTYALDRHYPSARGPDARGPDALTLVDEVMSSQARLVARWLGVGFVHGVMNTDNCSIAGETIDYGPCAFLDEYDPRKTFSSIDHAGRYAFENQPRIALWNVARLAEALLPLIAEDQDEAVRRATELLEQFSARFSAAHLRVLSAKLGLHEEDPGDRALAEDLLRRMASHGADYTRSFRLLCGAAEDPVADAAVAACFAEPESFHAWAMAWRARCGRERRTPAERAAAMRRENPAFIPRNHRVEELIRAAIDHGDLAPFEALLSTVQRPYDDQPERAHLAEPPRPEQRVRQTFCGT